MPWKGYNFEDAIVISEKVVKEDLFTSIHISEFETEVRDTKLGEEELTPDIPNVSEEATKDLDQNGIIRIGATIKEGDIITKVGEVSVNSTPQLQEQIGRFRPGDKVNVTVIRDGSEKTFAVVLRNKDGDTKVVKNDQVLNLLGGTFENISKDDQAKLGIQGGVKISKLMPGKLRSAGIREGFIITSIDKKPVRTMEDIDNALKTKQGGVLVEGIYPNGLRAYYGFGI